VIKWRYCDCGTGYRGKLLTCPDCRRIEVRKPQVCRIRPRRVRICMSEGCMSAAAPQKRYCPECRERLDVTNSRSALRAAQRVHSPAMEQSVAQIREQVARMAEIDPFYCGGPE
jgi:hypothetical protein